MILTLSNMAEKFAALDGRDPAKVYAQLKNPRVRGLLRSSGTVAGAAVYDEVEVARARILALLTEIGFNSTDLETIAKAVNEALATPPALGVMRHPESAKVQGGGAWVYGHGLQNVIRGVRHGEDWRLQLRFWRQDGDKRVAARVYWAEDGAVDPLDQRVEVSFPDKPTLGVLKVPLTPLLAPLVAD